MRFLRHSLTGLLLLSLTLGLLIYAGALVVGAVQDRMTQTPRAPRAQERVFTVNTVTAAAETIVPVLTAFGEVRSRRTLEIRAAAAGTVVDVSESFVEGGQVAEGEVLVRVDPADAQAALDRAEADLSDARAEARDAARALDLARDTRTAADEQATLRERAFQRQADLRDRGVGTEALVETAELSAAAARQAVLSARQALAQAEARIDQSATAASRAEIARDEARRRLDDTTIRAEFAGTLTAVTLVEGRRVSANEQLAQLVDPEALEVAFRVSTPQYTRLLDPSGALHRADVTVTLDVFGMGLTAPGQISRDSAAVGEGQTGRLVFARLASGRGLKPGDFVTVAIEEPPLTGVVRLPAGALDASGAVLVLGADGRLETLPVVLERRQGDDVLVRAPAIEGRQVVADRTPLLGPGIKVRPLSRSGADTPDADVGTAAAAGADSPGTGPRTGRAAAPGEAPARRSDDEAGAGARARSGADPGADPGSEPGAGPGAQPDTPPATQPGAAGSASGRDTDLVELSPERRARLRAFVETNARLPADVKSRMLTQLDRPRVPARMVERIEARIGG